MYLGSNCFISQPRLSVLNYSAHINVPFLSTFSRFSHETDWCSPCLQRIRGQKGSHGLHQSISTNETHIHIVHVQTNPTRARTYTSSRRSRSDVLAGISMMTVILIIKAVYHGATTGLLTLSWNGMRLQSRHRIWQQIHDVHKVTGMHEKHQIVTTDPDFVELTPKILSTS